LLTQLNKVIDQEELFARPELSEAVDLFTAFQAHDYIAFLDFYRRCDFLSAVAIGQKVDVVRYRALAAMCRGTNATLGDKYPLDEVLRQFCFNQNTPSKKYGASWLEFCGLEIKRGGGKNGEDLVVIPKKAELADKEFLIDQNARTLLDSGPEILAAFQPFYLRNGYDPALKGKLLLLDMERPQVIFGRADPHELAAAKKQNVFKTPRMVGAMGSPVSVGAMSSSSEEKEKPDKEAKGVKLVKREDVKKEGKHQRDRDSSASTGGKVEIKKE